MNPLEPRGWVSWFTWGRWENKCQFTVCVCVCNSFTLTPCRNDMQPTATIYIFLCICIVYHFLSELGASPRPAVASMPLLCLCCPYGARLWNCCDASAKSKTASTVLVCDILSILPLPSSPGPPNSVDMLLKASPTLIRSSLLSSLNCGQSNNMWWTLSCSL